MSISANPTSARPASTATGSDLVRQIAVILATVIAITVNILANALPINGRNTGAISDMFPVFFTPAGYVFAIWGVIYIGWIAYTVYQALPSQRANPRLRSIGWLYVIGALANAGWIFCWHYLQFTGTLILMVVLLLSLILIYLRLAPGRSHAPRAERYTTDLTFSVYLGWITVATVANVTDWLFWLGWNGGFVNPQLWALLMMVVATVLGFAFLRRYADIAYSIVLIWSLVGIAVRQAPGSMLVAAGALVLAVVLVIGAALTWQRGRSRQLAA